MDGVAISHILVNTNIAAATGALGAPEVLIAQDDSQIRDQSRIAWTRLAYAERAPLIVMSHGGPTSEATAAHIVPRVMSWLVLNEIVVSETTVMGSSTCAARRASRSAAGWPTRRRRSPPARACGT